MGRRRGGKAINGWLVVDKPRGTTSAAVVALARRTIGAARVGHCGTLDPLATGVLPLAFGEATKTVSYAMERPKHYRFVIRWGEARATEDAEGAVTETSAGRPTREEIARVLDQFTGEIEQIPPVFSAIKVGGRRAYDLARAGESVKLEPRIVRIESLKLSRVLDVDHAEFDVCAGKGAYMRSLARDLARALGTVGHLAELRRTRVGPFLEEHAISLEILAALGHSAALENHLLPIETALDDIPALAMTEQEARHLRHGRAVPVLPVASRSPLKNVTKGAVVCAMTEGKPVALARIAGGEIRPLRVLNL
ncbi:MAG: tRNA pseudouridine(55) synthase TruB [Rhodospirillales bacterium]|nr:tRNA pseudouridine(55) synthase TruB [Rhodospirillales bacterium]